MGFFKTFASVALAAAAFAGTAPALGEPMDPALERLVVGPDADTRHLCHAQIDPLTNRRTADFGRFNDNPADMQRLRDTTGRETCTPDHKLFKLLMNQWGFAFAPSAMHSARTTGFGGFHLSLEGAYTKISNDETYWKLGTQGPVDPSSKQSSIVNKSPDSVLQLYSVKLRKSFGFGLEFTGAVGFMPNTSIIGGGADVRLSLLEGFRLGVGGILPDVAVGGGVRTITGTSQFQLTTGALDVQISKPLPIADSSIITPWVGYQRLWIFADSGLIDLTPATDPIGYCGFTGTNVPGNPDLTREDKTPGADGTPVNHIYDGQPVCNGGSPLDFNNNVVFNKARLERHRMMFGLNYRFEMVMVGGQFITDVVDPADAQVGEGAAQDKKDLKGEERQWTLVLELGAMF